MPKGQEKRVLEALKVNWNPYGAIMGEGLVDPTGHTIEPFGIGMETGGRLAVDDTAGAFDLMRRTWGTMIDPANPLYTGAFWEFKNTDGGVNRTDGQPGPRVGGLTDRPADRAGPRRHRRSAPATRPGRSSRTPANLTYSRGQGADRDRQHRRVLDVEQEGRAPSR